MRTWEGKRAVAVVSACMTRYTPRASPMETLGSDSTAPASSPL